MRHRPATLVLAAVALVAGCGTTVPLAQQTTAGTAGLGPSSVSAPGAAPLDGSAPVATSTGSTTTPGGSAPSVPGGTTSFPSPGPAASGPTVGGIPATGFGWDRKHAYLGIPYQDTASTSAMASTLGVSGLVGVDYQQAARAVLADVNKHGGLFGRTVEPVFANFPPLPNQTGQSQCATWTQDNHVFAATNMFYDADTEYACLAKAHVPFGNGTISATSDEVLAKYRPYARKLHVTSTTHLDRALLTRLKANGFFQGWNTVTGTPGPKPVKVGVLCRDDFQSNRDECTAVQKLLRAQGYDVAATFHMSGATDETSGAVLQFNAAGVTHVFCITTDMLFFMLNASNQQYYPRYAVTSLDAPFLLASNAPKKEMHGALGVGFSPLEDTPTPPSIGPAHAHCLAVMRAGGIDVPASSSAQLQVQAVCDEIYLWTDAARAGGGLDPAHVVAGLDHIKGVYDPGAVFASGLSSTRYDEAAAVRDLAFNDSCSCFRYLSTTNWPS